MPVVRDGDAKCVNIIAGDEVTKVIVLGAILASVVIVNFFDSGATAGGIDVTDGDDSAVVGLEKSLDVAHPHTAQADKPHRQAIARCGPSTGAESASGNNVRPCEGSGSAF